MITGGELRTYGIIADKDPISDLIVNDDVMGLREALQSRKICISDRTATLSKTLLHVSPTQHNLKSANLVGQAAVRCGRSHIVKELIDCGADLQAIDW